MEKKTIVTSFFWTALETYSAQGIAFIVSIFMARMLMPSDYGILGIIGIFIALSDTFIDSGFTNALINKKDCSGTDYSTVFYFNVVISFLFFTLLYLTAPLIASFYDNEILIWTTRAMALTFVISSFGSVPMTILTKELRFKAKAIITLTVSICSGIIGILLAYNGWGVWALVWQIVLSVLIRVVIYVVYVRWRPMLVFSKQSFKELFGFGSKLLGSNIIFTIYNNIYSLVIGKVFSPTQLGYFTRADGYSKLIPNNISGVLGKMLFPLLSKLKDKDEELISLHADFIIISSYYIFPGCLFLAGFANPLVYLLISEKWMPIVPILQILCLGGLGDHFTTINSNFILAKGKPSVFLKNHLITKPAGIIILAFTVFWNIEFVAWGKVIYSVICVWVSFKALRTVLQIRLKRILFDVIKIFLIAMGISLSSFCIFLYIHYSWINLLAIGIVAMAIYYILTYILCKDMTKLAFKSIKRIF